jgi:hypothetical protein
MKLAHMLSRDVLLSIHQKCRLSNLRNYVDVRNIQRLSVTEQHVTSQRRFADSDPDFATIIGLAAHYYLLCMAATSEGSRTHRT